MGDTLFGTTDPGGLQGYAPTMTGGQAELLNMMISGAMGGTPTQAMHVGMGAGGQPIYRTGLPGVDPWPGQRVPGAGLRHRPLVQAQFAFHVVGYGLEPVERDPGQRHEGALSAVGNINGQDAPFQPRLSRSLRGRKRKNC